MFDEDRNSIVSRAALRCQQVKCQAEPGSHQLTRALPGGSASSFVWCRYALVRAPYGAHCTFQRLYFRAWSERSAWQKCGAA